jgi:uncharacterized membrane protein YkvA (DUF1232 family)
MFHRKSWMRRALALRKNGRALYLAVRDPRVPWYAKATLAAVAAYAVSPVDLVPDFIPVLGQVDDMVLLPLGIALAIRLIPEDVWQDCLARAEAGRTRRTFRS